MKKLSVLLLIFIMFLMTGCTQKEQSDLLKSIKSKEKIVIGVKGDSKPFGYIQNGENKGFDIDIAKNVALRIFNSDDTSHIEFVPLKAAERITALNSGKVDILIATLSVNEKRKAIVDFSKPYYVAGQALMVPYYSKLTSIEQLNNNKKVAVVLGTTGEKTVRMLAPNATSIGAMNYKGAFKLLKTGEVDAILADDSLLYGLLTDNKGYKILTPRYTQEYYAIGLRKGEENLALKKQLDIIIDDMQQTGKLNRIKEKWIPKNTLK